MLKTRNDTRYLGRPSIRLRSFCAIQNRANGHLWVFEMVAVIDDFLHVRFAASVQALHLVVSPHIHHVSIASVGCVIHDLLLTISAQDEPKSIHDRR